MFVFKHDNDRHIHYQRYRYDNRGILDNRFLDYHNAVSHIYIGDDNSFSYNGNINYNISSDRYSYRPCGDHYSGRYIGSFSIHH
jgi:uncharacterized protein YcfL